MLKRLAEVANALAELEGRQRQTRDRAELGTFLSERAASGGDTPEA